MNIYKKEDDKYIQVFSAKEVAEDLGTTIPYLRLLKFSNRLEERGYRAFKIGQDVFYVKI